VGAALSFLSATAVVLFAPKILAGILVLRGDARPFGGRLRATLSLLLEIVFSMLLAPIRMLFHTQFVLAALTGLGVHWKSPPREDAQTGWGEALRRHGAHTVLGGAWAAGVYWLQSPYVWLMLLPVVGPLTLSIPISVYSSRVFLGRWLREAGLLRIPEETNPPAELRAMRAFVSGADAAPGFVEAVVNPRVNAMVCGTSCPHLRWSPRAQKRRDRAIAAAVKGGPRALTDEHRLFFLADPVALSQLHFEVWTAPAAHPHWIAACRGEHTELRQAS
jgi:membrane glycosyltransferase